LLTRRRYCCTAAAAAKINAQIQAKKGIQHVDVPPIRSSSTESPGPNAAGANQSGNINGEMYLADGDYIKDIEVNDLRNRYLLTKGSTQKMVNSPCEFLLIYFRLLSTTLHTPFSLLLLRVRTVLLTKKHASSHANPLCGIC
jgi:hypothetical protein